MAEVAFFGDGSQSEDAFPEELILGTKHISKLIQSLQYEAKEVDLLESYTEMLLSVHPDLVA